MGCDSIFAIATHFEPILAQRKFGCKLYRYGISRPSRNFSAISIATSRGMSDFVLAIKDEPEGPHS